MIESLNIRISVILGVLALTLIWVTPNFFDLSNRWWFTKSKIVYGLDIQGGLHLVMGVDTDTAIQENVKRLATSIEETLKEKGVSTKSVAVTNAESSEITIQLNSASDHDAARKELDNQFSQILQVMDDKPESFTVRYYDMELRQRKGKIVEQAIETIRNRIDEFGIAEPSITAQGTERILVQLPGIKNAERAKELINKTARLDFMMVHDSYNPVELAEWIKEVETKGEYAMGKMSYTEYISRLNKDLAGKIPEKSIVLFEKNANAQNIEAGNIPFLLRTDTNLGGDDLKDAFVTPDQYGSFQVAIHFSPQGGNKFADLTEKNVGKRMAVVLDKVIKSSPSIREKIPNGRGVIEMGSGRAQNILDEAQLVATALRAGSLPASLQQLEERTVGPSLGADSIAKGVKAGVIGALLVIVMMTVYYKTSGLIANVALVFNTLILLAVMSSMGATLTLPGIAGIALSLGMAIDNNVLIFERIKEELAKGASWKLAIKEGYGNAFSAIFDGNTTTMLTCAVLIYFGTGPVRGFAVTLTIGLAASMFTAIFVTRAVFDYLFGRLNFQKISI